jgi:hypothetical protein
MNSSPIFSPQTDPWKELNGYCAPLVLSAPKTWGDPLSSAQTSVPQNVQGVVGYVLRNLVGSPWNNHLVLLVAVLYSQNIQYRTIENYLSTLHSGFLDLFAVLGLQSMTEWEVDTHLTLYLSGQVLDTHTASQRADFWKKYQAASRHLKRWLTNLPLQQQELYRPYVLPYPDDPHELTRLSGQREVKTEQQERRKENTDAIMPFFADLRTQAHLRYTLLLRLRKAYHKAIKAVEQGKAVLPFEFEMREGGNERLNRPPTELLVFKLWDRRTLVLAHAKERPPCFTQNTVWEARNGKRAFSPEHNSYLLEFVRAESLDGMSPVVGLWFLELLERDVLGTFSRNSQQELEAKQSWLREQGYGEDEDETIHPFQSSTAGVLLSTRTSGDSQFMQNARDRTRVIFIPIEPLFTAATFGMVALHIFTANGMRIGELQQLRASSECIVPLVIPPAPDALDQSPMVHWAVRAVPKGHRTPKTYYLDDEHLRLLSLIKLMLCEHYGIDLKAGGDLPVVAMRGKNAHRFPPDHYFFQYHHQGLTEKDVRACMRFLVHGLVFQTAEGRRVTILPHLLRHGFATWALNVAK